MSADASPRALAERIAADLFTNSAGQKARRLRLELEDGSYGGGWAEIVVVDRIAKALTNAAITVTPEDK